jgi:predicted SnoaL-like aldol condensation-catalyzing enzyme
LQLVVAGRIDEAYQRHVDIEGRHHNPFFPAGFPALKKAMLENHVQFPNKQLIVKLVPARRSAAFWHAGVLGDGDLVAVHSHLVPRAGEKGIAVVHLFRFHGSKIVEMWDCGQPVPTDSPNKDGAF